jgi:hypothetical protein
MTSPYLSPLEASLGRALPEADRGSVPDLNDMPEQVVAEAKKLASRSLVRELLEYYSGLKNRPYLPAFIDDVIDRVTPVRLWRRGDVLVPAPSLADQLCLHRDTLLAPIGGYDGVRIVPDLGRWRAGDSSVGAPAKCRPDANYRSGTPMGSINLVNPELEPATSVEITVRRWIASRIARCSTSGERTTIEGLLAHIQPLPALEQWSQDARIAVAALMREFRVLPSSEQEVPGFRGPDNWYDEA